MMETGVTEYSFNNPQRIIHFDSNNVFAHYLFYAHDFYTAAELVCSKSPFESIATIGSYTAGLVQLLD